MKDLPVDARGNSRGFHGPFVAVRSIVRDGDGLVLLLRRAAGGAGAGAWCLPGGKVDFDESAEVAAARELGEETGLVCKSARFLFYQDSPSGSDTPLHFVNLYFECEVTGAVTLNEESSEFRWIRAGELDQIQVAFRNAGGLRRYWALHQNRDRKA